MKMSLLGVAVGLVVSFPTLADGPSNTQEPALDAAATTSPGLPIYSERFEAYGFDDYDLFTLERDMAPENGLAAGTHLWPYKVVRLSILNAAGAKTGFPAACLPPSDRDFVCLQDLDRDGKFEHFVTSRSKLVPKKFALVPYRRGLVRIEDPTVLRSFKGELIYLGAADGVLRLVYREYSDDMARPAFAMEAAYDLAPTGETLIKFKGAQIRISQANNVSLDYVVEEPFDWSWHPLGARAGTKRDAEIEFFETPMTTGN